MSNGDYQELVDAPEGWRVAIKQFDGDGFTYGSLIPKSWFFDAFGIEEPKPQTSLKQAQEANLGFLGSFKRFAGYLLNERSMALKTIWGEGYEIVTPAEQTEWAELEMNREMKKAFARAAERLINIDHAQLTAQQTEENANALARMGSARALVLGRNRLTSSILKQLTKGKTDEND